MASITCKNQRLCAQLTHITQADISTMTGLSFHNVQYLLIKFACLYMQQFDNFFYYKCQ